MRSTVLAQKKKRGPPATGKGEQIVVRMQPAPLSSLDAWIEQQPEPKPTRAEAIRRLVEKGLAGEGGIQPGSLRQSDASLDRQIDEQKAAIAEIPEHSEPSPEAAMAAMDKALAKNDLIDMKNKRTRRKNA
jgi:hypothetical protein